MARGPTMLVTMTEVAVFAQPTVKFFDRSNAPKLYHDPDADGRRPRLSPAEIARHSTGVDRTTGQRTLGVGVESRSNGTVRFEADLWRLDCNLASGAQAFLADLWRLQNVGIPAYLLKRMERHFGPTHFRFDALLWQVEDWREFLAVVLSDAASYAPLEMNCGRER